MVFAGYLGTIVWFDRLVALLGGLVTDIATPASDSTTTALRVAGQQERSSSQGSSKVGGGSSAADSCK